MHGYPWHWLYRPYMDNIAQSGTNPFLPSYGYNPPPLPGAYPGFNYASSLSNRNAHADGCPSYTSLGKMPDESCQDEAISNNLHKGTNRISNYYWRPGCNECKTKVPNSCISNVSASSSELNTPYSPYAKQLGQWNNPLHQYAKQQESSSYLNSPSKFNSDKYMEHFVKPSGDSHGALNMNCRPACGLDYCEKCPTGQLSGYFNIEGKSEYRWPNRSDNHNNQVIGYQSEKASKVIHAEKHDAHRQPKPVGILKDQNNNAMVYKSTDVSEVSQTKKQDFCILPKLVEIKPRLLPKDNLLPKPIGIKSRLRPSDKSLQKPVDVMLLPVDKSQSKPVHIKATHKSNLKPPGMTKVFLPVNNVFSSQIGLLNWLTQNRTKIGEQMTREHLSVLSYSRRLSSYSSTNSSTKYSTNTCKTTSAKSTHNSCMYPALFRLAELSTDDLGPLQKLYNARIQTKPATSHEQCNDVKTYSSSGFNRRTSRRKQSHPVKSVPVNQKNFSGVSFRLQTVLGKKTTLSIQAYFSSRRLWRLLEKKRSQRLLRMQQKEPVRNLAQPQAWQQQRHNKDYTAKHCASCGTRKTPLWRDAEDGTPLCNACGIRYKKYKIRCLTCCYIPRKAAKLIAKCLNCGGQLKVPVYRNKC